MTSLFDDIAPVKTPVLIFRVNDGVGFIVSSTGLYEGFLSTSPEKKLTNRSIIKLVENLKKSQ